MNSSGESAAREHTSTLEIENANSNGTRYKCGCKIWKQFGGPWSITHCSMHAARESERNGWIPVSERLPERSGDVLIAGHAWTIEDGQKILSVEAAFFNRHTRLFWVPENDGDTKRDAAAATHWRPLPAAPSVAAQGEQHEQSTRVE